MTNYLSATFFSIMSILCGNLATAQQVPQMEGAVEGSYVSYYKYFDTTGRGMPPGSVNASKAVVALESYRYFAHSLEYPGSGSGFFIRTKRNDGKICLITAAHVIRGLASDPQPGDKITMEMYLKYFGADNNGRGKTISCVHSSVNDAVLAAFSYKEVLIPGEPYEDKEDYALLLVDKRMIPLKTISTLGYNLNYVPLRTDLYYTLGHPFDMPMRIADSLRYDYANSLNLDLAGSGNNNIGSGSSGGPLLIRNASGTVRPVIGLMVWGLDNNFYIPDNELVGRDKFEEIDYNPNSRYIRLSYIAPQIRQYAQAAISATQSSTTDPYLEDEEIDNTANWEAFQVNASATSMADLNNVSCQDYAIENPGKKLIRAKSLTMNFEYQASSAAQNMVTNCLNTTTNLESGFSYTAAANTEFSIHSIVSEPQGSLSTAMRSTNNTSVASAQSDSLNPINVQIYPNPSHTGVFTVSIQAALPDLHYILQLFAADGKRIYEKSLHNDQPNSIDIHQHASGTYFAVICDNQGKILFRKTIIY